MFLGILDAAHDATFGQKQSLQTDSQFRGQRDSNTCDPKSLLINPPSKVKMRGTKIAAIVIGALGMILHFGVGAFGLSGGHYLFTSGLMAWSWLPYIVGLWLASTLRSPIIAFCGMLPALIFDATNVYVVFVAPTSSTAALGLLWVPLWNLLIVEPVGLAVGWWVSKGPLGER